jgi:hypothetical protein
MSGLPQESNELGYLLLVLVFLAFNLNELMSVGIFPNSVGCQGALFSESSFNTCISLWSGCLNTDESWLAIPDLVSWSKIIGSDLQSLIQSYKGIFETRNGPEGKVIRDTTERRIGHV